VSVVIGRNLLGGKRKSICKRSSITEPRLIRAFDFGRRERDPVLILEDLIGCRRLAVDPDQVLLGLTMRDFALEERADRSPLFDLDIICETAAVVIDEQNFHELNLSVNDKLIVIMMS